jgi:hypothetical protein
MPNWPLTIVYLVLNRAGNPDRGPVSIGSLLVHLVFGGWSGRKGRGRTAQPCGTLTRGVRTTNGTAPREIRGKTGDRKGRTSENR